MTLDVNGTIGNIPSAVSLCHILNEIDDPKLTKKALKLVAFCHSKLKQLKSIKDRPTYLFFIDLLSHNIEAQIEDLRGVPVRGIPCKDKVATHLMACTKGYIRNAKEKVF